MWDKILNQFSFFFWITKIRSDSAGLSLSLSSENSCRCNWRVLSCAFLTPLLEATILVTTKLSASGLMLLNRWVERCKEFLLSAHACTLDCEFKQLSATINSCYVIALIAKEVTIRKCWSTKFAANIVKSHKNKIWGDNIQSISRAWFL